MLTVDEPLKLRGLQVGVVCADGVTVRPSSREFMARIETTIEKVRSEDLPGEQLRQAVRNLLRTKAFKPTGRSKPASEYLSQAAKEGRFPFINNLVDINNYLSLKSGCPISLLDRNVTGARVLVRDGLPGEKYVFNEAGHEIDLNGLICVCRREAEQGIPLGTAVKDSMAAKLKADTSNVVGIVYAPRAGIEMPLTELLESFADLLRIEGGAREASILMR